MPRFSACLIAFLMPFVASAVQVTFQQGLSGYAGTLDKEIRQDGTDSLLTGEEAFLNIDGAEPNASGNPVQVLLRFDGIFGPGPGQIPLGASILSASLQLNITNTGNGATAHQLFQTWNESSLWSGILEGDGITPGVDAGASVGTFGTVLAQVSYGGGQKWGFSAKLALLDSVSR